MKQKCITTFKTFLTVIALCCLPNLIKAQTTFSATTMRSDTISSVNPTTPGGVFINDSVTAGMHVTMEQNLEVQGNTKLSGKLLVNDSAKFNSAISANQGFMFNATKGFKLTSVTNGNTTSDVFLLGKQAGAFQSFLGTCPTPFNGSWFLNNGGGFISAVNGQIPPYQNVNASIKMYTGTWNGDGFIEVEGSDANGTQNNSLLLNYFCGRDILLNTGPTPGKVILGPTVNSARNINLGYNANPYDGNNAFNINMAYNSGPTNGIALYTGSSISKAITLNNGTTSLFTIYGDGRTYIGVQKPISTGPHANAKLAVDGKILAKEIYVNIHNSVWADYVFDKNYKLMPLNEVENFVTKNKHLPNVPSAKDLTETDDYNLSIEGMQKIQMEKIEELYLYIIQQQKDIEALKQKNAELELKLKK